MFCENCGNPMNDDEKFCQKCGTPAPGQARVETPVQAPAAAPAEAPQPYAPTPEQAAQPYVSQQYPAAPKAPKKPLSPLMKKIILFGSIGVAVIAAFLVVLFVVIVPGCQEAARVDITKYYTIEITNIDKEEETPSVLDGKIDGHFNIDYKKFAKDYKVSEEKAEQNLEALAYMLELKATDKDGKEVSSYIDDMKSDDVYKITVSWPGENAGQSSELDALNEGLKQYGVDLSSYTDALSPAKTIAKAEKELGVEFKHKTLSREIKVGDALKAQGISLIEPTEMDVLGYVKENNLLVQDGHRSGDITLSVKAFETTFGDYTVKKSDDDYYSDITVKKGDKEVGSFDIELSDHYYLKSNDEITVSYDSYDVDRLADKGVVLTGDEFTYTVVGPEEFTLDVAKKNIELLKTYFNDNVVNEDWKADAKDQITLNNIYYSTNSDGKGYIVYVYTNTTQKYCKTMYMNIEYLYVEDGKLNNDSYCSTDLSGKDIKEAIGYCSYLKSPYTPTQIL